MHYLLLTTYCLLLTTYYLLLITYDLLLTTYYLLLLTPQCLLLTTYDCRTSPRCPAPPAGTYCRCMASCPPPSSPKSSHRRRAASERCSCAPTYTYHGYTILTVASLTTKVVLCTNVAETSLTVDDCCVVIDSGKQKSAECARAQPNPTSAATPCLQAVTPSLQAATPCLQAAAPCLQVRRAQRYIGARARLDAARLAQAAARPRGAHARGAVLGALHACHAPHSAGARASRDVPCAARVALPTGPAMPTPKPWPGAGPHSHPHPHPLRPHLHPSPHPAPSPPPSPIDLPPLQVKVLGLCGGGARAALGLALEPPPREAVEAAARQLRRLGAISVDGASEALTPLGTHLARMPVDLRVGKMLLYGAMGRCNPTHTYACNPTHVHAAPRTHMPATPRTHAPACLCVCRRDARLHRSGAHHRRRVEPVAPALPHTF